MGALLVLSLKNNNLQAAGGKALAEGLKGNQVITELNVANNDLGFTSGVGPDMSGVIAHQQMMQKVGCNKLMPLLADITLTELDISGIGFGSDGAVAVAKYISDNGAISSVNLLKNRIGSDQAAALATILKEHATLKSLCGNTGDETELDMNGKDMDAGDVTMLAAEVVGNRAVSSVNLLKNKIGSDQAEALISMLKEHPTLKSLCGNRGDETELDMNGKMDGAGDAIMFAAEVIDNGAMPGLNLAGNNIGQLVMSDGWQFYEDADEYWKEVEGEELVEKQLPVGEQLAIGSPVGAIAIANAIKDMRAMTSLDVSNNRLYAEGTKLLAEALRGNQLMAELNLSSNEMTVGGMSGVVALADAIPDMGAMTSLNLSRNRLGAEGAKHIAESISVSKF
jgi:Ran GTPase-activating protein (RanGAP) involved in mRNA processing and transport